MAAKIFVTLPVKNLKRSIGFFAGLGYEFDPRFTDENAACLILGENHYAMLITEKSFATFTPKAIVDAERNTEVLVAVWEGSGLDPSSTSTFCLALAR